MFKIAYYLLNIFPWAACGCIISISVKLNKLAPEFKVCWEQGEDNWAYKKPPLEQNTWPKKLSLYGRKSFDCWMQISANRGPDSRFELEANLYSSVHQQIGQT